MVRSCSLLRPTTEKIFSHFKFLVFVFFQNATADFITKCYGLLLKNATSVITKCDRYYKVRQNNFSIKQSYPNIVTCTWVPKRRKWSRGGFLNFDNKRDRGEQHAKTLLLFFYRWVDCSTVKDHSYFVEIYLFVSPCFHSDIFLTWGSHWKHAERVPFISFHRLLNVGCFIVLVSKLPTSMLFFIPPENLTTKLNLRILLSLSPNSLTSLTFGYF